MLQVYFFINLSYYVHLFIMLHLVTEQMFDSSLVKLFVFKFILFTNSIGS